MGKGWVRVSQELQEGENGVGTYQKPEKWSISCPISKPGCQWWVTLALQTWISEPLRQPGREQYLWSSSYQAVATPYSELENSRLLAPDSPDAYVRQDFNEPRLSHFPIYRKALNSLRYLVLIHRNTFDFQTTCFVANVCKTQLLYPPPPNSCHLRRSLPSLKSWKFPPNVTSLNF